MICAKFTKINSDCKIIYLNLYFKCETVLEIEPSNVKALYRRGQSYLSAGEPTLALADFEKVLAILSFYTSIISNQCVIIGKTSFNTRHAIRSMTSNQKIKRPPIKYQFASNTSKIIMPNKSNYMQTCLLNFQIKRYV